MDVYVPDFQLRIVQGWDRTDTLFFQPGADERCVALLAKQHGLCFI